MAFKFFTIRVLHADESELNSFLSSHRILSIQQKMILEKGHSYWAFSIEYLPKVKSTSSSKSSRIDYKEVLSEEDFSVFSRLRELRKNIGKQEGVPIYTIFTNEQLAEIARKKPETVIELSKIEGIGEAKLKKYAESFLNMLRKLKK
ncbi:HRDC domain-containing protein [candidate division CSSED10-310 bacterium]|uniref:HRDC domain-containing protein n=1 Tax=candidate division CSSED10-310 bacterium TaxID=2855610 RepID=A0ABV6Z3S9_UNCC1